MGETTETVYTINTYYIRKEIRNLKKEITIFLICK